MICTLCGFDTHPLFPHAFMRKSFLSFVGAPFMAPPYTHGIVWLDREESRLGMFYREWRA